MGKLNGDDLITSDNMNDIKEFLINNFIDVNVDFEEHDNNIYIILDNKKYQLFPNTKVSDLIGSFDQMYKKSSDVQSTIDNNTFYNRNVRAANEVRNYRIDLNEDLYNALCERLKKLSSDISLTARSYDSSMLTEKLAKFYNDLDVDNDKDINNIKEIADDLYLKIKYSIELYNSTDQELLYFFNSMVTQIFAYDDFKNGGSVQYLTVEERSENIKNYIDSLTETYDALWEEYLGLYGNGLNEAGVILESDAADLLVGIMKGFHIGVYDIGCNGRTESGKSYIDYNPLCDTLNFIKENKVLDKLKRYSGGESWEESGMSELNYYVLGYIDSGYLDRHHDNEMSFLVDYFENQDEEFIDESRGKYGYKSASTLLVDENNTEFIDVLKNRINSQTESFNFKETQELVDNKIQFDKTLASLSGQIHNLKQCEIMMPYDELRKDPEFLKYLGKTYDAKGEFEWYDQTELAMYHYVYEKEGFDSANDYLKALEDTVNQRKGFVAAAKFVELLNAGHEIADIANELSPILGTLTEGFVTVLNTGITGVDGLASGLYTFGKGFYNLAHADGAKDAADYTLVFKSMLMSEENEYNSNMSDWQRQLYYHNNQIMSSIGNMAIPCLLAVAGHPMMSKASLFLSAMGNATESTMQEGYTGGQAYLFGALSATLELSMESVLGTLPGIGGNAPQNLASLKGVQFLKALGKSMFDEGKEEFIQAYAEAGLKNLILGEPFDLSQTSADAVQSFVYGAISSGIMNAGGTIPIKLKTGNVVKVSSAAITKFNDTFGSDAKIVDFTEKGNCLVNINNRMVEVNLELLLKADKPDLTKLVVDASKYDSGYFSPTEVKRFKQMEDIFSLDRAIDSKLRVEYSQETIDGVCKELQESFDNLKNSNKSPEMASFLVDFVRKSMERGNPYVKDYARIVASMVNNTEFDGIEMWDYATGFGSGYNTVFFDKNCPSDITIGTLVHELGHAIDFNFGQDSKNVVYSEADNSYHVNVNGVDYNFSKILESARSHIETTDVGRFFEYEFEKTKRMAIDEGTSYEQNNGLTYEERVNACYEEMKTKVLEMESETSDYKKARKQKDLLTYVLSPSINNGYTGDVVDVEYDDATLRLAAENMVKRQDYIRVIDQRNQTIRTMGCFEDIYSAIYGGSQNENLISKHSEKYYGGAELVPIPSEDGGVNDGHGKKLAEMVAQYYAIKVTTPNAFELISSIYGEDLANLLEAKYQNMVKNANIN